MKYCLNCRAPFFDGYDLSNSVTAIIPAANAPKNFIADSIDTSYVSLSWSSYSGANFYKLYLSDDSLNGSYRYLGSSDSTTFEKRLLDSNTGYYFKLIASTNSGIHLGAPAYVYVKTK